MPNPKPWLSQRAAVLVFLLAAMLLPGLITAAYALSVHGVVRETTEAVACDAFPACHGRPGAGVPQDSGSGTVASQATSAAAPPVMPGTQTTVAPPNLVVPMADRSAVQRQIDYLIAERPITFAPNSTVLTPISVATVAQIAEVLRSTPTARIEVDGHVASTPGREPDPKVLSDHRALAVRAQLASLGVNADRITAVGFGDTMPVASGATAQGRAANRRAEIIVR